MAKANQTKWFADALLSASNGYRSFEALAFTATNGQPAGAAMQPGQILTITGGAVAVGGADARIVLLQAVPARTAGQSFPALVLARDAEVNDAYLLYAPAGANMGVVNTNLTNNSNIIVRPGVLATSTVVVVAEAEPPMTDPPEHAAA